jgi:hypothetical protein
MQTATLDSVDIQVLIDEVRRYLAAVDAFRTEGREPRWRRELADDDEPRSRCDVLPAPPISLAD